MQESLQIFAGDHWSRNPGPNSTIPLTAYTLLGCVLEGAASQKFVDYVRDNVFRPAGMEETQPDDFFAVIQHRARWYHQRQIRSGPQCGRLDSSYKIPGGGLISSAETWRASRPAILAGQTCAARHRALIGPFLNHEGKPSRYALGCSSPKMLAFAPRPYGWTAGDGHRFLIVPERRAGV